MFDFAELDDRIAKCEKILAADQNSQIFAALAEAYRKKGDVKRAQDVCIQGLKSHPNYSSARIVLAKILMDRENFDAAWEELKKAIGSSGRTRTIDLLESEILIHKGQQSSARAILEKLFLTDPENDTVRNLLAIASDEKQTYGSINARMPERSINAFEPKRTTLTEAVGIIKVLPRVMGVAIVGHDGMVLEGRFDSALSKEDIAALSKSIFNSVTSNGQRCNLGMTAEILIETCSTKIWIIRKVKFLVVILTRDDVSLGSLRLKVAEIFQQLENSESRKNQEEVE